MQISFITYTIKTKRENTLKRFVPIEKTTPPLKNLESVIMLYIVLLGHQPFCVKNEIFAEILL